MKSSLRKYLFFFLIHFVKLFPPRAPALLLTFIRRARPGFFDFFCRGAPFQVLSKIGDPLFTELRLIPEKEVAAYQYRVLDEERYETNALPRVFGLSDGGEIKLHKPRIRLLMIEGGSFHTSSDIIRIGGSAFWEKQEGPRFVKIIPVDRDLVRYEPDSGTILVKSQQPERHIDAGFSLCGVHVNSWGHFIANFYPKLRSLAFIESEPDLKILVPSNIDQHEREILNAAVQSYGNYEILYLGADEVVQCRRLYYCTTTSFIADHASYFQIADTQLSRFSLSELHALASNLTSDLKVQQHKKIFIARRGGRNLLNYEDVESIFDESVISRLLYNMT